MKIAVMGAGAVGCYFGGMLARAGHEVMFIGRPLHVAAIEKDGLRLQTSHFDARVHPRASTDPAAVAGAELVLFCVKSADTESAGRAMAPHLAKEALVLTLQNGVDNADRLRKVITAEVAAAVVYVATEMAGPGHVLHHGRGDLRIEPSSSSEKVAEALSKAGVPTSVSYDVRDELWGKLTVNCAYNALSAITQLPYGMLTSADGVHDVMRDVVSECVAVAEADGVTLPDSIGDTVERLAVAMPGQYSSTAQDLGRGKKSEIDYLNGMVVRRGEALGVATPVNRVLLVLVRLLEDKAAGEAARNA
jgi:2-dehydropantoate 2-reductase